MDYLGRFTRKRDNGNPRMIIQMAQKINRSSREEQVDLIKTKIIERMYIELMKNRYNDLKEALPSSFRRSMSIMMSSYSRPEDKSRRKIILEQSINFINCIQKKARIHERKIKKLKRENAMMEEQIRAIKESFDSSNMETAMPITDVWN